MKDNIPQAQYIIAPATAKKTEKVKKRFFAGDNSDDLLAEFCHEEAYRCQLDDTSWVSFDDLAKVIPIDRIHRAPTCS